jgi:hypothetical protein
MATCVTITGALTGAILVVATGGFLPSFVVFPHRERHLAPPDAAAME